MANVQKTVDIIFGGKDKVTPVINQITGAIGDVDKTIHKVTRPLADFGESLLKWEAALATVVAGGIGFAIKTAGDFTSQIAEVSTLTKMSSEDLGKFSKDILEYSRNSKKSIDDINSAIYQAISLGADYKDSLAVLVDAEKLSIAGKADLTKSTELLLGTLNAYGNGIDSATRYSDIFFQTVKLGKTTIPELAEGLSKVTGIAASAKVPIETLSAAIAALTASGMDTQEALTAIRGVIANIITPSTKATETAKKLGVEFNAAALQTKGLDVVLKDIYTHSSGNVETIGNLFENVRALNGALILGADSSDRFKNAIVEMGKATGSTEEAYQKMVRNFGLINQNLINNLKATIIELGEPLLKVYGDTATTITEVFKGLSIGLDAGSFKPLYDAFEEFSSNALAFIDGIAKAIPEALKYIDFSPIVDSLRNLGGSIGKLFEGLDLTKPNDLAKAIQGIIDTIGSMITITSGMVKQLEPLWDLFLEGVKAFNANDDAAKEVIGRVITLSMEIEKFGATVVPVLNFFGEKLIWVAGWLERIWTRLKETTDAFASLFSFDTEKIKSSWVKAFTDEPLEKLKESNKKLVDNTIAWWDIGAKAITEDIDKIITKTNQSTIEAEKLKYGWQDTADDVVNVSVKKIDSAIDEMVDSQGNLVKYWTDESGFQYFEKVGEAAESTADILRKNIEIVKAEYEAHSKYVEDLLTYRAKIKTEEFQRDIKVIETQAEVTKKVFDSISESISDTGEELSKYFEMITSPETSRIQMSYIKDQIERENRRRDEVLDLQRGLTEAQIDQIEAQTEYVVAKAERLRSDQPLIEISAEGLKPHLEAIMWEIMEAVQVRMNEEGAELLLGAGQG